LGSTQNDIWCWSRRVKGGACTIVLAGLFVKMHSPRQRPLLQPALREAEVAAAAAAAAAYRGACAASARLGCSSWRLREV